VESDGFPIFAKLLGEARDIGGARPSYATHDFDIEALVLKRSL
jgi:hypothetical protein